MTEQGTDGLMEPIESQNERLRRGLEESYQVRCMLAAEREAWKARALREMPEVERLRRALAMVKDGLREILQKIEE